MWSTRINKRMLRMKLHYFLYLGGVASVQGFLPTIAKQLGYSPMAAGYLFTYLSILSLLAKPVIGIIVDKFPVKRITFLTVVLSCGVAAFALNFVEVLPMKAAAVRMTCNTTTTALLTDDIDHLSKRVKHNTTESVKCQLVCQQNDYFRSEMCKSWNVIDYCTNPNNTFKKNKFDHIFNVSLYVNTTMDQVESKSVYRVISVQFDEKEVLLPVCRRPVTTRCEGDCLNDVITGLVRAPKSNGYIFGLRQFWEFFIVISVYWISQSITWSLQDPICFDLLDNKPEDFGRQRCWGSIGWGFFSMFGGVLVDYFSDGNSHKNYTPVYYLCLIIIVCDFALARKIQISETVGSKYKFSSVFKLLTKPYAVVYFTWVIVMGILTSLPWNYLLWYMEDIGPKCRGDNASRTKTLQGLAVGIQCVGGEVPFLFFTGWFVRRIGYRHCMSLGLFAFAVRFHLYSAITDPVWILPVEFVNGITFGLCHAVLVAYARIVAPPNSVTTVVGFSGALFEGVGSSLGGVLGGYMYETHGGAWTFQIFSYVSFLTCILHVIFVKISKSNEYELTNSDR